MLNLAYLGWRTVSKYMFLGLPVLAKQDYTKIIYVYYLSYYLCTKVAMGRNGCCFAFGRDFFGYRFRLICHLRVLGTVMSVIYKAQVGSLPVFFFQRMVEFLFVYRCPEKHPCAQLLSSCKIYFCGHVKTNPLQGKLFQLFVYLSNDNNSKYNFFLCSLPTTASLFHLGNKNSLTLCMDRRIHSPSLNHVPCPSPTVSDS